MEEVKIPKKRGRKPKKVDNLTEVKIPKKRGRKPKIVDSKPEVKIPKKRGRKPKKKIDYDEINNYKKINKIETVILHLPSTIELENSKEIINDEDPKPFNNSSTNLYLLNNEEDLNIDESSNNNVNMNINIENLNKEVVIPISNKTKQNKEDFDTIMDNLHKKRDIDIINSLNVEKEKNMLLMYDFIEYNTTKTWPNKSNIDCLWCCCSFDNEPYGLPIKKENKKYVMFGNFCSPECVSAYNFDSNNNDNVMWERYSMINYLYSNNISNNYIKIALPRLSLKKFGGPFTIEKFRELSGCKTYKITTPPMVPIIPSLEEIIVDEYDNSNQFGIFNNDFLKNNNNNNELRLKRTKPLPDFKNTLDNCMQLTYV